MLYTNKHIYTLLYINYYLAAKDPRRIKFFDKAGVKLPDIGTRLYGHSSAGTCCVEVVKKAQSPNTTLNMLVSLDELEYYPDRWRFQYLAIFTVFQRSW